MTMITDSPSSISTTTTCTNQIIPNSRQLQIKLNYSIDSWSSHTCDFTPYHILHDKPNDQSSRWSSGSRDQDQYILLKLEKISIFQAITFGKYQMPHVCNLKEFKVFAGMDYHHLYEVLHTGLRNDSDPETFPIRFETHNIPFPCLYVKIVPLLAWGASFNYGIWFIELRGLSDPSFVDKAIHLYNKFKEIESTRLVMKYLYSSENYIDLYVNLKERSGINLEHDFLTNLSKKLRTDSLESVEEWMTMAQEKGFLDARIKRIPYKAIWKKIYPEGQIPQARGGHQLVIDENMDRLYLFGGWNGKQDLNDLWVFDNGVKTWTCITEDVSTVGGPSPRSVHRMVLHQGVRKIFTLGRFIDPSGTISGKGSGGPSAILNLLDSEADFYSYDIDENKWTCLSHDTRVEGGPDLIYDHQMVIDEQKDHIYVFGGKSIRSTASEPHLSGLYRYDIANATWTLIRADNHQPENTPKLKSRVGHSMLFNPRRRQLYILCGQRYRDLLNDFYVYDVETDTVVDVITEMAYCQVGPASTFTQRATIDVGQEEIYVLSGREPDNAPLFYGTDQDKTKMKHQTNSKARPISEASEISLNDSKHSERNLLYCLNFNSDMLYEQEDRDLFICLDHYTDIVRRKFESNIHHGKDIIDPFSLWHKVLFNNPLLQEENTDEKNRMDVDSDHTPSFTPTPSNNNSNGKNGGGGAHGSLLEPTPRFAHQFVLNIKTKVHYLFGGTVGETINDSNNNNSNEKKEEREQVRLNDLWELRLSRPNSMTILQKCKFLIRRQRYLEMIYNGEKSSQCLKYLQSEVRSAVDFQDPVENEEYRTLPQYLFKKSIPATGGVSSSSGGLGGGGSSSMELKNLEEMVKKTREQLEIALLDFFPKWMKQPSESVYDFIG